MEVNKKPATTIKDGKKHNVFVYSGKIDVKTIAAKLSKTPAEIIGFLFLNKINDESGKPISLNSVLGAEVIELLCMQYDYAFETENFIRQSDFKVEIDKSDIAKLAVRPPIITIMGHVDHGKTTLLDYLRKSRIAEREIGGITQSVGTDQIQHKGQRITILDPPGHEAY
jgi:translation initiation factor IF-2